jgi:serine/threonine protein kinase
LAESLDDTTQLGDAKTNLAQQALLPSRLSYFGDYELLEEIARGGMGVVYRARQVSLNRIVAVKMVLAGAFAGKEAADRFRLEAEAAAGLRHPHIVGIHEVGTHEGFQYFSMDYIAGSNLSQAAPGGAITPTQAAEWVRTIAQAIHYAHEQGILHRDLKPSNILIDAAMRAHVTDFGLAKQMREGSDITLSGQVIGSPNYMPPEQAQGSHSKLGPTVDVYSLGAVLFYLLTGRPPFVGADVAQTLHRVIHDEVTLPRLLNPHAPEDLQTICLKCLEKEPSRRYQTAQDLADELQRFLRDEPIQARPVSGLEKARRWCRRKPAIAALLTSLVLSFLLGAGIVLWQLHRVELKSEESQQQLSKLNVLTGAQLLQSGDYLNALLWFTHALQDDAQNRAREPIHRLRAASILQRCPQLVQLISHEGEPISDAAFGPSDDVLATVGQDRTLRLWAIPSGRQLLQTKPLAASPFSILFNPQGSNICVTLLNNRIVLVDAHTGALVGQPLPHLLQGAGTGVLRPRFDPTGRTLVSQPQPKCLQIIETAAFTPVGLPLRHSANIEQARFSSDGSLLFVRTEGGSNALWNAGTGTPLPVPVNGMGSAWASFFSEQNNLVLVGNQIWSWKEGRLMTTLPVDKFSISLAAFGPAAECLLVSLLDRTVQIFDASNGKVLSSLSHEQRVSSAVFSPDGARVLTIAADSTVRIWDCHSGRLLACPIGEVGGSERIGFSASGRYLGTTHSGHFAAVWNLEREVDPPVLIKPHMSEFINTGREVVLTTEAGGPIRYQSLGRGAQISLHPLSLQAQIQAVWFDASNRFAILKGAMAHVQIWDAQSGLPLTPLVPSYYSLDDQETVQVHLPTTDLTPETLVELAELLSGNRLDGSGGWSQLNDVEVHERWLRLSQTHPQLFAASESLSLDWHARQTEAAAGVLDWRAAQFHAGRILRLAPDNRSAHEQIEYIQKCLRCAHTQAAESSGHRATVPPRDPRADAHCLDLTPYYTDALASRLPLGRDHISFRAGFQKLGGIDYDVRGAICLFGNGAADAGAQRPDELRGIEVHRSAHTIHFLHFEDWAEPEGKEIARIIVHYSQGDPEAISIQSHINIADDWMGLPLVPKQAKLVWMGTSPFADAHSTAQGLYSYSWQNPHPDREILRLDLVSAKSRAGYNVFAITLE